MESHKKWEIKRKGFEMSKEIIEYCKCDVCGKKGAESYKALAYRTFSSTDSTCKYSEPRFETVNIDLCDECAAKVTALHDIGVYCEKYEIKPISEK